MIRSGKTTVASAGTAVSLGTVYVEAPVMIKAPPTNTGLIYIGNDVGGGGGDVDSGNGLVLSAGDAVVFDHINNLAEVKIDATVNGEGVAWLTLK